MPRIVTSEIRPLIGYKNNLDIINLPFVADIGNGEHKKRSLWSVKPNGNYGDECLIGKAYALEYLQYAISDDSIPITFIIKEMPQELTGIEVGFLSTLQEFSAIGATAQARAIA